MRRVPRGSVERPDQLGHREMRTRVQLHTSDLILSQMPSQQQILHPSGGLTAAEHVIRNDLLISESFRAGDQSKYNIATMCAVSTQTPRIRSVHDVKYGRCTCLVLQNENPPICVDVSKCWFLAHSFLQNIGHRRLLMLEVRS